MRWTWAMCADERDAINLGGYIKVEPVYIPLAMCAMDGLGSITAMLKGLFCALLVCKVLKVKRWNGEIAVNWMQRVCTKWYRWVRKQFKQMK